MIKRRGTRRIAGVTHRGPEDFVWHLECGHELEVRQPPRLGQRSAICEVCRGGAAHPERSRGQWKRSARDPESDALAAEAHAEEVQTDDAWSVAADAWEVAGDLGRARLALFRSPRMGAIASSIIPTTRAINIRERWDRWQRAEARYRHDTGRHGLLSSADLTSIAAANSGELRPTEVEMARLYLHDFVREPPARLFGYWERPPSSDDRIRGLFDANRLRTFNNDVLGTITTVGARRRARGTLIVNVTVRAVNGFLYHGTCNLETGTYCKLRRGKSWLRR